MRRTKQNVQTANAMWDYIDDIILPGLALKRSKYIQDDVNVLVGAARIRQQRKQPGKSVFPPWREHTERSRQEKGSYNMSWQTPVTLQTASDVENPSPWHYQTQHRLVAPPLFGQHQMHDEGGYSVLLLKDDVVAGRNHSLNGLREANWVDGHTEVVLVEFTVFNPATNLFTNVVLFFEFIDIGSVDPFYRLYTARLYMLRNLKDVGIFLCAVAAYVLIMLRARRVWRVMSQQWQQGQVVPRISLIIEIGVMVVANGALVCYFIRHAAVMKISSTLHRTGDSDFVNFYTLVMIDKIIMYALAAELSIACVNTLKLLDLNIRILVMSETMRSAFEQLKNIVLWVAAMVMLFVTVTVTTLGPKCREYCKVSQALLSICSLCLYEPKYGLESDCPNITGVVFVAFASMCFVVFGQPILCVMYIHARFDAIQNINQLNQGEEEFLQFVWRRLNVWFGWWSVKQYQKFLAGQEALKAKANTGQRPR